MSTVCLFIGSLIYTTWYIVWLLLLHNWVYNVLFLGYSGATKQQGLWVIHNVVHEGDS